MVSKIYKVVFKTAFKQEKETEESLFHWNIIPERSILVIANNIENAVLFARKNFVELSSRLTYKENEHPVDIEGVTLYSDSVCAMDIFYI